MAPRPTTDNKSDHDLIVEMHAWLEDIREAGIPSRCATHTEQIKTLFANYRMLTGAIISLAVGLAIAIVNHFL